MKLRTKEFDGGSITIQIITNPLGSETAAGSALNAITTIAGKVQDALGLADVKGVDTLDFSPEVRRTAYKGTGRIQSGLTAGFLYFNTGTISMFQSDLLDWIRQSGDWTNFMLQTEFDIVVLYSSDLLGNNGVLAKLDPGQFKITLKNCRPKSTNFSYNTNDSGVLLANLTFDIGGIDFGDLGNSGAASKAIAVVNNIANAF